MSIQIEEPEFVTLTTAEEPYHRQFEYWADAVCDRFTVADAVPEQPGSFAAKISVHRVGPTGFFCGLTAPRHRWHRSAQHIRQHPFGVVWLVYFATGRGEIEQSCGQVRLGPGSLMVYSSELPFDFRFGDGSIYLLCLTHDLATARCPGIEAMFGDALDMRQLGAPALRETIEQAVAFPSVFQSQERAARYAGLMLDLLSFTLEAHDLRSPSTAHGASHFARAMNYVRANLDRAEIDCDDVAQAIHVSRRTLTRSFAREGSTVMKAVMDERLRKAHDILVRGQARNVSEVAYACGFSDLGHFSRSFRAAFGTAPRLLLAARH